MSLNDPAVTLAAQCGNGFDAVSSPYQCARPNRYYAELVRDVVKTHPDLIVALAASLSLDFKMATTTIPVVAIVNEPTVLGLVPSIARPGGNITGVTISAGLELVGKRIGLLVEAMPKLSTVGYLVSRSSWDDQRGA